MPRFALRPADRVRCLLCFAIATGMGSAAAAVPVIGKKPPMPAQKRRQKVSGVRVEAVASGLTVPWALAFSPDGRLFFTERAGHLRVIRGGGQPESYLDVPVLAEGEGGLMGLALHPQFPAAPYVYVMYTLSKGAGPVNRISRFRDVGSTAVEEQVLLDDIPAAVVHDGGVLEFGPDGMLYAGTGDARQPDDAQDIHRLNGKILRIAPDGSIPADNPFPGSPVYAYGFRNVSGLAWHPVTGALWASSHGPTGELAGLLHRDTVYVVKKGGNHGWPLVVGVSKDPRLTPPVLYYPTESVPPGRLLFYTGTAFPQFKNNLFMPTLGSTHLQRVVVTGAQHIQSIERWWTNTYGRLRAIRQAPDGSIYFTTSNQDGRANRNWPGSDFIYRIVPARP